MIFFEMVGEDFERFVGGDACGDCVDGNGGVGGGDWSHFELL